MPPKGRTAGAKKARRKEKKNVAARPRAHQEHVQQHDRLDHRPRRATSSPGPRRATSASRARASPRRSPRSSPPRTPPARPGARREEGRRLRQGPGFGSRDRDPFAARRRPRGRHDPDVTPQPHNGAVRPSGAGSERRDFAKGRSRAMARYTGPVTRKSRRLDRPRRRRQDLRAPPLPARPARPRADQGERVPAPSCRRSRRPASPTASWRSSSAATTRRPAAAPARPARTCCSILETRLDNVVYRAGLARTRRAGPPAGQPRSLPRQRREGRRPELPGLAVRHHRRSASSRSRPSRSSWRARPPATARSRPGCRSCRAACRSSSTSCPSGRRSTRSLTEQLIVEFYSKN